MSIHVIKLIALAALSFLFIKIVVQHILGISDNVDTLTALISWNVCYLFAILDIYINTIQRNTSHSKSVGMPMNM